jgi:REP element-mobilizing transposase RayT/DNA-binding NarL/FixJ family response regulator
VTMQKRVLILTPSPGFGGMIRQVLDDSGDYDTHLFMSFTQALELADKAAVALIILDAEMGGEVSPERMQKLREHAPHAKVILIPAEKDSRNTKLDEYNADTLMSGQFYLPDLVAAVEQFFGPVLVKETSRRTSYGDEAPTLKHNAREASEAPAWLEDVTLSARYLTQLSLESASQAALITRGEKVWAYAGELPKQAADELANAVATDAANGNNADLARFIHLNATKSDYMMYATALGGDYTLALVFDAQMPFSQMRAQVSQVAKALASAPLEMRELEAKSAPSAVAEQSVAGQRLGTARFEMPSGEPAASQPGRTERKQEPAWPGRTTEYKQPTSAQPAAEGMLRYAFVLVPRLPKHRLEGDLAEKLATWLPELCVAYAWRLESMTVQPGFLQWMVSMPAGESPETAVRTLDAQLSLRIFDEFPRIGRDNPSGHFWAPGFMVLTGTAPTAAQVNEYVEQTRARQGVSR